MAAATLLCARLILVWPWVRAGMGDLSQCLLDYVWGGGGSYQTHFDTHFSRSQRHRIATTRHAQMKQARTLVA